MTSIAQVNEVKVKWMYLQWIEDRKLEKIERTIKKKIGFKL